jgi:acetate kinase
MKILVLNFRMYSIEYEVFDMPKEIELCSGVLDHIGFDHSILNHTIKDRTEKIVHFVEDHKKGLELIISTILHPEYGCLKSKKEIDAIGHRIVHGGWSFRSSVLIRENVKKEIYDDFLLAPLHNPYNLKGIEAVESFFPGKKNVAVFDTSFHQTIPEVAFRYALPERVYQEYKIRKYGFHGISHKYISEKTAKLLKKRSANLISFHLGIGASACAIKNGKSVDTSMGFTPTEGLVMTNRPGDVDAGAIVYLMKRGWSLEEVELCINRESGTFGISGISNEMEQVVKEAEKGNKGAKLAIEIFVYRARKYLGAYWFVLGGDVDAISFTGGIGGNSPIIREKILAGFEKFGIKIDSKNNERSVGVEGEISAKNSKVKIFVLPRNEKILIARETMEIVKGR